MGLNHVCVQSGNWMGTLAIRNHVSHKQVASRYLYACTNLPRLFLSVIWY